MLGQEVGRFASEGSFSLKGLLPAGREVGSGVLGLSGEENFQTSQLFTGSESSRET